MSDTWTVRYPDGREAEMDTDTLKRSAINGDIYPSSMLRSPGSTLWSPAQNFLELRETFAAGRGSGAPLMDSTGVTLVRIIDVDMTFTSMVGFMIKWGLASIPAIIIVLLVVFVGLTMLGVLGGSR